MCNDWWRALFDKHADHGNVVMVAQFVLLCLVCATFQEISKEMDVKTLNVIVKNNSTTIFHSLYCYQPWKWHQNIKNFAVKPLTISSFLICLLPQERSFGHITQTHPTPPPNYFKKALQLTSKQNSKATLATRWTGSFWSSPKW